MQETPTDQKRRKKKRKRRFCLDYCCLVVVPSSPVSVCTACRLHRGEFFARLFFFHENHQTKCAQGINKEREPSRSVRAAVVWQEVFGYQGEWTEGILPCLLLSQLPGWHNKCGRGVVWVWVRNARKTDRGDSLKMTLGSDWSFRWLRSISLPAPVCGCCWSFLSLAFISSQLLSNAGLSVVFGEESVFAVLAMLLNTLSGRRFLALFTLSLPIKPNTRRLFTAARMALCSSLWRDWIRWFI